MLIQQNASNTPLIFKMLATADGFTPVTGLTVTATLSKNGAAFAAAAGAVTELAGGWYQVAGNATDCNTLGALVIQATGTGAVGQAVAQIVAFNPRVGTNLGLSCLPTVVPGDLNGLFIAGSNAQTTFRDGVIISRAIGAGVSISAPDGIDIQASSGHGINVNCAGATGSALFLAGGVSVAGVTISGGTGISVVGNNGGGLDIQGLTTAMLLQGGADAGLRIESTSAQGVLVQTNAGHGFHVVGGIGFSAMRLEAQGNGDGLTCIHSGTGKDIRGNIFGSITSFTDSSQLWDEEVESGISAIEALRLCSAALFGRATGGGTTTLVIKNPAGDETRITMTVDASGNRSNIVLTP